MKGQSGTPNMQTFNLTFFNDAIIFSLNFNFTKYLIPNPLQKSISNSLNIKLCHLNQNSKLEEKN